MPKTSPKKMAMPPNVGTTCFAAERAFGWSKSFKEWLTLITLGMACEETKAEMIKLNMM